MNFSQTSTILDTTGLNLLLPDGYDIEREAVAHAFARCGGTAHRIGRFWDPPAFERSAVRVYGGTAFCLVLQQKLDLELCSPRDDLILAAPFELMKREIALRKLGAILPGEFPTFVKPVIPKQFRAGVYKSPAALDEECRGLPPETAVFVSEIVNFTVELCTFLLKGAALDAAIYEGKLETEGPAEFLKALVDSMSLPRTVVADVGLIPGRGWAIIEFNPTWGAGLNGCDAEKIVPAIVSASELQA